MPQLKTKGTICSPQLKSSLKSLDSYTERIPLSVLRSGLEALSITVKDLQDFVRFRKERYQRNLIHQGPAYQALLLCWRNGQRSPIHDHRGSSCGVRILEGTATETIFERNTNGLVYPVSTVEMSVGQISATQDADIHQVSNLMPGADNLLTLHVYSPPLLVMGRYSLTESKVIEYRDPVYEFSMGEGI